MGISLKTGGDISGGALEVTALNATNGTFSSDLSAANIYGTSLKTGGDISGGALEVTALNATSGTFSDNVSASEFITTSDRNVKTNIQPIENSLSNLLNLNGVSFAFKDDVKEKQHFGFIAQDVEPILPILVQNNEQHIKGVNYQEIIPLLVESIKTLKGEIDSLKQEINELKK